jgi:hypothetical protein
MGFSILLFSSSVEATELERYFPQNSLNSTETKCIDFYYSLYEELNIPVFVGTPDSISAGDSELITLMWDKGKKILNYTKTNIFETKLGTKIKNLLEKEAKLTIALLENEDVSLLMDFDEKYKIKYFWDKTRNLFVLAGVGNFSDEHIIENAYHFNDDYDVVFLASYRYEAKKVLWHSIGQGQRR